MTNILTYYIINVIFIKKSFFKIELPSLPGSDVDMPSSVQVSKYNKTVYNEQDDFIVISDSDVEEMGGGVEVFLINRKGKSKRTINPPKL